jgi:hypothetical protein
MSSAENRGQTTFDSMHRMIEMMENPIKTIMPNDLLALSSIILAVVKRKINYSML